MAGLHELYQRRTWIGVRHSLERLDVANYKPYQGWKDVTEAQIVAIKKRDCEKCYYSSHNASSKTSVKTSMTCDYMLITGKMRGCMPGECRNLGIFLSQSQKGKRVVKPKVIRLN